MTADVGTPAPDFELPSQTGERVRLSSLLADKVVVLFFYPKDDTPGCTAEACAFRDAYDVFAEAGAEVIGISADAVDRHKSFAGKHNLNFRILSDRDREARNAYGVKDTIALLMPGRETFVIDKKGIVRHRFSSQFRAQAHVKEALEVVRQLAREERAGS